MRKSRKLIDLEVEEISLVDRPANRQSFAIIKSALPASVQAFLEGLELEKTEEEARAAVVKALETLATFEKDFPGDILQAVKVLAKWAMVQAPEPEPEPETTAKRGVDPFFVRPRVLKGGGLWPSLNISKGVVLGGGVPGDDDLPEPVPERRGFSKSVKGQGDMTIEEPKSLWPSLCR
jgi:hypothetical protein